MHAQTVDAHTTADEISAVFAELHLSLGRELATVAACHDAAPVRADHDPSLCRWCGIAAVEHETPGDPDEPDPFQDSHVAWPGHPPETRAETDATLLVAAEEMRLRGGIANNTQDTP